MKAHFFKNRLMVENCSGEITPLPGGCFIQKLVDVCGQARSKVDVIQYQWNFYPFDKNNPLQKFNEGFLAHIRAGLRVRVLLNIEGVEHRLTSINHSAQRNLTEAGANVKFGPQFPITHAKIFIIDDDFVILGSHNLSKRSVTANDETSVLIKSREATQEFERYFNALWDRS